MKNSKLKIGLGLAVLLAVAGVVWANQWGVSPAAGTGQAAGIVTLPTTPASASLASATNVAITNYTGTPIQIMPNATYVFTWTSCGSNGTNAGPTVLGMDESSDGGTTYSTTQPLKLTNTMSGTNYVTTISVLTGTQLAGIQYVLPDYFSGAGSAVATTNVQLKYNYYY